MRPNIDAIKELVNEKFEGNKAAFGLAIGVDRAQVSKLLKDGTGAGALFFGCLMVYCEKEGLEFRNFIFLPKSWKKERKIQCFVVERRIIMEGISWVTVIASTIISTITVTAINLYAMKVLIKKVDIQTSTFIEVVKSLTLWSIKNN